MTIAFPGGGVAPTRVQKGFEDLNGDGFLDLDLKFDTPALNEAGLLGQQADSSSLAPSAMARRRSWAPMRSAFRRIAVSKGH